MSAILQYAALFSTATCASSTESISCVPRSKEMGSKRNLRTTSHKTTQTHDTGPCQPFQQKHYVHRPPHRYPCATYHRALRRHPKPKNALDESLAPLDLCLSLVTTTTTYVQVHTMSLNMRAGRALQAHWMGASRKKLQTPTQPHMRAPS